MKKNLIIKDRNKTIYFKNRKVRTPCTLEVTDREFERLQLSLKMADIQHYSVEDINKDIDLDKLLDLDNKEVIIEELEFESDNEKTKTILEKLMNGDSE